MKFRRQRDPEEQAILSRFMVRYHRTDWVAFFGILVIVPLCLLWWPFVFLMPVLLFFTLRMGVLNVKTGLRELRELKRKRALERDLAG